jgi:23S rRNA pseudouridine2605 synthase
MMRLNKYLAHAGVASRRAVEELIVRGRVRIDGKVVKELGTMVPDGAEVEVDHKRVMPAKHFTYLLVHKPVAMMTTMSDPEGRRTIAELIPKGTPRVVPVGRLDYDSSGVLLMTDDGDLANRLLHPSYGVEKTYRAVVKGKLLQSDVKKILEGVRTSDFRAAGAKLAVIATRAYNSVVDISLHEGRNRQVRKMFEALGHPVLALERTSFGPLKMGTLPPGLSRMLTPREVAALQRASDADAEE